jgi:hypothetical protein
MAFPAMKIDQEPGAARRFGTADLSKHGGWIMRRLLKAYPNQNERGLASWLRETINNNSSLFLCTDYGVALFQVSSVSSLEHKPWVWERFVFAEVEYEKEGAEFYSKALEWAKNQGIKRIIVNQLTDIPLDLIKAKFGGLSTWQMIFAKV